MQAGITLTALTPDFTMTGIPGQTVQSGPVTYNVETDNLKGYTVTVLSDSATMDPLGASPDVIPIADLTVRETGTTADTAMSNTAAVNVHTDLGQREVLPVVERDDDLVALG